MFKHVTDTQEDCLSAFRSVPRTGVIYVSTEAAKHGFALGDQSWCNLGQGQPDTGELANAPKRIKDITIQHRDLDYAPVAGLLPLREAVASLYNTLFRKGLKTKYSAENVAISAGGRTGIIRACACIAPIYMGHFLPDYTAYEELLDVFRRFHPIPILLDPNQGYEFSPKELKHEILGRGLGALLMSNPCNPTGKLISGHTLSTWVDMARDLQCAMLMDEFYSHYIWVGKEPIISAAKYVEDVDRDPIVIFDGLTKNWRYPGFRLSWTVGPKSFIESVTSAGSFLDGGACAPIERAAIPLLETEHVHQETKAIQAEFSQKREVTTSMLQDIGIQLDIEPEGTFYAWGNLSNMPPLLCDSQVFFREALKRKVICVPGSFFDVNPGKRRIRKQSRFQHHVRFSFGPTLATIKTAIQRIKDMITEMA